MPIRTRTSVVRKVPGTYETIEIELDDPRQNEVTVKIAASGLCHSDDHVATGDIPVGVLPYAGGHEGAGVITAVGPNTPGLRGRRPHRVLVPARLRPVRVLRPRAVQPVRPGRHAADRGPRRGPDQLPDAHPRRRTVGQQCGISTFSEYTTASTASVVKIDKSIPLRGGGAAGLRGAGRAAVRRCSSADVAPGDTVIVMGIGGIGASALQGAAHAGATTVIAVDPVARKREWAAQFGATHAFATIDEAADHARSITNGQGADAAIVTVGVIEGEHVAQALSSIRKAGTVVLPGAGEHRRDRRAAGAGRADAVPEAPAGFAVRRVQPAPRHPEPAADVPGRPAQARRAGHPRVHAGPGRRRRYEDMHAGRNIRGVIVFD